MPMEDSIEPSYDAVRDVIQGFGFHLEVINYSFFFIGDVHIISIIYVYVHYCLERRNTHENTLCAKCK